MDNQAPNNATLASLFPEAGRVFLTGTGKQLVERIGAQTVRRIVLDVLQGENVRDQTEPLTRQRITQISSAVVMMFLKGWSEVDGFSENLSRMAFDQLTRRPRGRHPADVLPAQWVLGLTEKQVQNVLRDRQ